MVAKRHLWLFSSEAVKHFIESGVSPEAVNAKYLTLAYLSRVIDDEL